MNYFYKKKKKIKLNNKKKYKKNINSIKLMKEEVD